MFQNSLLMTVCQFVRVGLYQEPPSQIRGAVCPHERTDERRLLWWYHV